MTLPRSVLRYKEAFLKAGIVDDLQMRSAVARLEQWGGRLAHILVEMSFAKQDDVMRVVSEVTRMPITHIGNTPRDAAALSKLEASDCDDHGIFPVSLRNKVLQLAVADPSDVSIVDDLQRKTGARVQLVLAPEAEIRAAVNRHYRGIVEHPKEPQGPSEIPEPTPSTPDIRAGFIPTSQRNEAEFDLDTSAPPAPVKARPAPPPAAPPPGFMSRPPSANTMLDEMFDEDEAPPPGFSPEDLQRLEAARVNQEKTTTIVRVLKQLLAEKGYSVGG